MKTKPSICFEVILILLFALQLASAQELTLTFTTPEGFSIKLPADWKRIDKQTLDDSYKALAKDWPNARLKNPPSDGFETKEIQQGIGNLNIMVIPNIIPGQTGNISEQEFKHYAGQLKRELQQKANPNFANNSLNASVNVGEVNYDEQKHFLRIVSVMSVPNFGLMRSIDAVFLTESGMLTFKFTSAESDYALNADLFSKIIGSIEIPIAMRIKAADDADNDSVVRKWVDGIAKGIGVCIAFALFSWAKRRSKKAVPTAPVNDIQSFANPSTENHIPEIPTEIVAPPKLVNNSAGDTMEPQATRREEHEIIFNCHMCNQSIAADPISAGQQFSCPNCGEQLVVPGDSEKKDCRLRVGKNYLQIDEDNRKKGKNDLIPTFIL